MFHYPRSRSKTTFACFPEAEEVVIFRIFWACYFQRNKVARLLRGSNTIKLSTCFPKRKRNGVFRGADSSSWNRNMFRSMNEKIREEKQFAHLVHWESKYSRTSLSKCVAELWEMEHMYVATDTFFSDLTLNYNKRSFVFRVREGNTFHSYTYLNATWVMSAEQISIMKLEHSMLFPKRKRKWQFGECRIIDFTNKCECIPRIDNTKKPL